MTLNFRSRQIWTIARLELRRVFFSKRSFWVYGLALFPMLIFIMAAIGMEYQRRTLSAVSTISPALMDSVREGERVEAVLERLGKPAEEVGVHNRHHYWDGQRRAI